jgi:radical SAM superfamily enzyme YgiQ (UPF0313 family)
MRKTLLIIPPGSFFENQKPFPYLGILVVARFLKDIGENVSVLDLSGSSMDCTIPSGYTHYGITCLTPNMPRIAQICRAIRAGDPEAKIILGGPHVTVTGLAKSDRSKQDWKDLCEISDTQVVGSGICDIFKDGTIYNDFPILGNHIPLREAIKLSEYHYDIDGMKATSIIAQSGCPFSCNFCSGRGVKSYKSSARRSIESIMEEIQGLYKQGYKGFMFYDDEMNINKSEFIKLLEALIGFQVTVREKLAFRGFSRADLLTYEEAYLMKKAGFHWLLVGFESGSDEMLKSMNKGVTVEQNTRAIEIARSAGLKVKALMSLGHPGECRKTVNETKDWLRKVKPDDFDVTIVSIYPGTPYYEDSVFHKHEMICGEGYGPNGKDSIVYYDYYEYTSQDGKKLYSKHIDFIKEESNYKCKPGESKYNCHVWTDFMTPKDLVEARNEIEKEFRPNYVVDRRFQALIPNNYPPHHRGPLIEDYAFDYFSKNPVQSKYTYLPIFWTGWFVKNNYGKGPNQYLIQEYVDSLPKDRKYWTIVQNDDGLFVKNFECKVFSCASIGDYAIPVLCDRHKPVNIPRLPYIMFFAGNLKTHPIRMEMVRGLMGDRNATIAKTLEYNRFIQLMCRSTFALCPRGYGNTSFRMYEAMGLGAIPIYISDVHWLPFPDKIDWNKCSVLVKSEGITGISKLIRSIKPSRIKEMQDYIKEINEKYFTFEGTCQEIANIVKDMK